jgi:16S rRNA (cytidine1402-2'-O)-methyltransferase
MLKVFGDRNIALCKELTKLHESCERTTLEAAVSKYSEQEPKGEFVVIVEGLSEEKQASQPTLEDAVKTAKELMDSGLSPTAAAKEAANLTGLRKNEIYRALINE